MRKAKRVLVIQEGEIESIDDASRINFRVSSVEYRVSMG